ncbi:MAG: DUF4167 domain-containing protein [Bosea sp. (in: a-proteobacteria)]|nr:DUF4167 domain-containing protein [Bosea sp. (in: a-proteobacteria)]
MRGRNNNGNNNGNRKSPNPLQRSYESNGPDVKVRGTAQHVAEKYLQLARDAQSSGDTVAAESYFQHAEHYYRILLAAQEQLTQQFGHTFPPNRAFVEVEDDLDEEGDDDGQGGFQPGAGPQPDFRGQNGHMNGNGYNGHGGQRAEGEAGEGQQQGGGQRFDRQNRRDRFNNDRNDRRFDRQDRGDRRFDRNGEGGQGGYTPRPDAPRSDIPVGGVEEPVEVAAAVEQPQVERSFERPERSERPQRRPRRERQPATEAEVDDVSGALPSFLTNPVRAPAPAPVESVAAAEPAAPVPAEKGETTSAEAEAAPVKRTRRRRSPREVMDALGSEADGPAE